MADINCSVYEAITIEAPWDLLQQDCNDIVGWTETKSGSGNGVVINDPAGQWKMNSPTATSGGRAGVYKDIGSFPATTFTVEIKVYLSAVGPSAATNMLYIGLYKATKLYGFYFCSDGLKTYTSSYQNIADCANGASVQWQTWRLIINPVANTLDAWLMDSNNRWTKVATGISTGQTGTFTEGQLYAVQYSYTLANRLSYIDYIYVSTGDFIPPIILGSGLWGLSVYDSIYAYAEPSWTLENNPCDDFTGWTSNDNGTGSISEISPAGQWHLYVPNHGVNYRAGRYKDLGSYGTSNIVIEIELYIDSLGDVEDTDYLYISAYKATKNYSIYVGANGVYSYTSSFQQIDDGTYLKFDEWQTWRFVFDVVNNTVSAFLTDATHTGLYVGSANTGQTGTFTEGDFYILAYGFTTDGSEVHVASLKIDTDASSPIVHEGIAFDFLEIVGANVYDAVEATEDVAFSIETWLYSLSVYDSVSIAEYVAGLVSPNAEVYDAIEIAEYFEQDIAGGRMPVPTQNCSWHGTGYYWRAWFDATYSRIVFEYNDDPDIEDAWIENDSARIEDVGVYNDFSVSASETALYIVYTAGGKVYARSAVSYPNTNFTWSSVTTVFTDVSDSYMACNLERVKSERFWATATRISGANRWAVGKRSPNKNDITAWDAETTIGNTGNTDSCYTCPTRVGLGATDNVVVLYTEGSALKLKYYSGGSFGAETAVATIKLGGLVNPLYAYNFHCDTDPNSEAHIVYLKSDGTVCEKDWNGTTLGSETVLDSNTDCHWVGCGIWGAIDVVYGWVRPWDDGYDVYYLTENVATEVKSDIIKAERITGHIHRLNVSSDDADSTYGVFGFYEGHPDLHTHRFGFALLPYEDLTVLEDITVLDLVIELGVAYDEISLSEYVAGLVSPNAEVYDEISIIEDIDNYLDVLFTNVYDEISIIEYVEGLVSPNAEIYDEITISEVLETYLDVLAFSSYEEISSTEYFQIFLDVLNVLEFQNISIVENFSYTIPPLDALIISSYDVIASLEYLDIERFSLDLALSIFETLSLVENTVIAFAIETLEMVVSQSITISEYRNLSHIFLVSISDSISIVESFVTIGQSSISIVDFVVLIDSVSILEVSFVEESDNISIVMDLNAIVVSDVLFPRIFVVIPRKRIHKIYKEAFETRNVEVQV